MRSLLVLAVAAMAALAQQPATDKTVGDKLAPYVPTPDSVVDKMLDLAQIKPGERVIDIGSGDGRFVIRSAERYKAEAYGIEIDHDLVVKSRARIAEIGLDKSAQIIEGDALTHDYARYDVVTVYLWPSSNERLKPILDKQLRAGARVVAHDFPIAGWKPDREVWIEDDGNGRSHTIYLYVVKNSR